MIRPPLPRVLDLGPEPSEHQALAEVCRRLPRAVVCLLSALRFHDIGTQQPWEVWIALPEGARTPSIDYPALRVVRLRGAAYREGVETIAERADEIRVYSLEKTIADCFKFRCKVGVDVALEALKDAWARRRISMDQITRYAQIDRVAKVMQPYLETVVA
jgi:predicted transcriptional regulator of viral defense system